MTTTLNEARVGLSKITGDYWASALTGNGAADGTTIVDTALQRFPAAWIGDEVTMFDMITSGTYSGEERKISSLSTSTLTVLAHGGQILSAVTYEVHRLFTPSDKRLALIAAARNVYPDLFNEIWDESIVSGNWLKDGSLERWTTSTNLTDWAETTLTATQTSTAGYVRHGTYSCRLNTAAGTLAQSITQFTDLQFLRGKPVTFTVQAWCDTASALRLSINDGVTQTYSGYLSPLSKWTEDDPRQDSFYVTQTIDDNASQVTFTIHFESAAATAYIDDARVIGPLGARLYIGHLGFAQNRPRTIDMAISSSLMEPPIPVRNSTVDPAGYLYLPSDYPVDRGLRLRGLGYLDFLSGGVASTDWTATIALDEPQIQVVYAEAALYLYKQMSMPNFDRASREPYQQMVSYWEAESAKLRTRYGMPVPPIRTNWGVS